MQNSKKKQPPSWQNQTTFRLDKKLANQLRRIAKAEGRKLLVVTNRILEKGLLAEQQEHLQK